MLPEIGKIKKRLRTISFFRLKLGFLRSFEAEPEKSHSYKKKSVFSLLCGMFSVTVIMWCI